MSRRDGRVSEQKADTAARNSRSRLGASPPSDLTFQAVLGESGEIDFVYCTLASMSDPDRASGGSATIGLENETGTAGIQHALDKKGAVAAGQLLRFFPAP